MQRPDEAKRTLILETAAGLFAHRPYHEVRLEDVATAAKLGKGTLYVYFSSKETLYLTLVREGFAAMVQQARLDAGSSESSSWDRLRSVINGLIRFGTTYPDLYRVMRSGMPELSPEDPHLQSNRRALTELVVSILTDGIRRGEFDDPHPGITAQFVLGVVRSALLYPTADMTPKLLEDHVMRVLRRGIGNGGAL